MPIVNNTGPSVQAESTRELDNILLSGEIAAIYLGGTDPENKVPTGSDGATNLDTLYSATDIIVTSSTGTSATIVAADAVDAGVMTSADKVILDGLVDGTTVIAQTLFEDKTGNEPVWAEGTRYYANGVFNARGKYTGVTQQEGEELYSPPVYNATGALIPEGKAVYITGSVNGMATIALAKADAFITSSIIGVTTMDIPDASDGLVTAFGKVSSLDTSSFTAGDTLYLSDTDAGGFVTTAPDIASVVGSVLVDSATEGVINVRVSNLVNLPTVLAYMNGGSAGATLNEDTPTIVDGYYSGDNVFMPFGLAAGTITTPSVGTYKFSTNITIGYDVLGNSEEDFEVILSGSISGENITTIKLPRNSSGVSFSPAMSFAANAGEVFTLKLNAVDSTLTNVTYSLMNFELESRQIRA